MEYFLAFIFHPISLPLGLVKVWFKNRRLKTFRQILDGYEVDELVVEGTSSILGFVAAIGALLVLSLLIAVVVSMLRKV